MAQSRRSANVPSVVRRRWLVVVVLTGLAVLALVDRSVHNGQHRLDTRPTDDWGRYHGQVFTVTRVVDGDTVDIDIPDLLNEKQTTRIRLWGVDTPEKAPRMHFADEATAFTARMVMGNAVRVDLHPDKDKRGKYKRLLAYVVVPESGEMLNASLIETGHAYADRRFRHQYMARFVAMEDGARAEARGLWRDVRREQWPGWRQRMVGE